MNKLSTLTVALLLSVPTLAQADGTVARTYSRKGEISPGAQAPTLEAMVEAIEDGAPSKLHATLEYGERVFCEACVPLLQAKLLESDDAKVREISAWWLRRQPLFAPAIITKLRTVVAKDASAERRARAAEALGEMMDPYSLPALTDAAISDKDETVRAAAVRALARLNSEEAGATFAQVLEDKSSVVKLAALDSMRVVGGFREYDALLPLLGDTNADVRARAARLVGEHQVKDAEAPLIAMLRGDTSAPARRAAAWALGRLGTGAAQQALLAAKKKETDDRVLDAIAVAERMR